MSTATSSSKEVYGKNFGGSAPENYERFFVPAIGAPLAADLIATAEIRAGERVLDVACGTGVVTRLAAERVGGKGSVAGLDVTAGMLDVARSRASAAGVPIKWYESTAESMPLPDDSFDVVLCQLGLQFIPDKGAALREMRRVVVAGGRVLVSVPTPPEFFGVLHDALERNLPAGAPFVRMVFSLNDTAEVERLFQGAGFREVTITSETKELHLPSQRDFLWQYVQCTPLAGLVAETDREALEALERDVVAGWQPWVRQGGVTYQQGMIVATARK